jgi:hypothetical protein
MPQLAPVCRHECTLQTEEKKIQMTAPDAEQGHNGDT